MNENNAYPGTSWTPINRPRPQPTNAFDNESLGGSSSRTSWTPINGSRAGSTTPSSATFSEHQFWGPSRRASTQAEVRKRMSIDFILNPERPATQRTPLPSSPRRRGTIAGGLSASNTGRVGVAGTVFAAFASLHPRASYDARRLVRIVTLLQDPTATLTRTLPGSIHSINDLLQMEFISGVPRTPEELRIHAANGHDALLKHRLMNEVLDELIQARREARWGRIVQRHTRTVWEDGDIDRIMKLKSWGVTTKTIATLFGRSTASVSVKISRHRAANAPSPPVVPWMDGEV